MIINGTSGTGVPASELIGGAGSENTSAQNTNSNFANTFSDALRDHALQSVMERMNGSMGSMSGGLGGAGGANALLGGLGGLSGIGGIGGLGGVGGLSGPGAMMGMPSVSSGMENTLISAAESGDMSGAQLMLFMMIMMMQSGSGDGGGDMSFILQMIAGMLGQFSSDAVTNTPNPMLMLDNMQGDTQTDIKRMVDAALSKVGYHEKNRDGSIGNGNFTKFGAWYGLDGHPWCAMFVSWAADQGGLLNDVVPRHASCNAGVAAYREKDLYATRGSGYIPREGDAIYFTNSKGVIGHVGIVVAFDPATNRVYTVEGNTSNAVRIRHYDLNNSRIHGYGQNGGTSFGTIPGNSSAGTGASIV